MARHILRTLLVALAATLLVGCGGGAERASLYRAEKLLYEARKAEEEQRLGSVEPDSAALMKLRAIYLKVGKSAPGPHAVTAAGEAGEVARATIRTVGVAAASGARLALAARRADLALEAAERLQTESASDTVTSRQAAFMAVAAYQGLRRYEDAIAQMKRILVTYRPLPPPPTGEDPVLAIPGAIVSLRRNLGDEEGAGRELRSALEYFTSLLDRPMVPELEAQVRARILRASLELNQTDRALQEANTLERLVGGTPALRHLLAEIAFAKGKLKATVERDPSEGIGILDRVSTDFPTSPLAARSLLEAATILEQKGQTANARARYEAILRRFPNSQDVAPLALYRLGMVQEKMGEWVVAKATLEMVPLRYPRSAAAAEAPMAVIQHYMNEGRRTAAQLYFAKAITTYRQLVERDSSGQVAPLFRVKMFQIFAASGDSTGVYSIMEEMLRNDSRHPYTAQILVQAARASIGYGNRQRAAAYLRRFLRDYPKSPVAGQVKRELQNLGG